MMVRVKSILKQKGQGIVEYAILLSLIVLLAMVLQSGGLKGSLVETFDSVALFVSGKTEQDVWARMSTEAILADTASSSKRLAADQEFLRNVGRQFLGMTKSELATVFDHTNTSNVLIGTFKESVDSNGNLTTEFYTQRTDGSPLTDNLYNWGQGNESSASYDSSRRYLYSDYAVKSASTVKTGSGIKAMNAKFDKNGRVTSIDIAVNPNSGGKQAGLYVTVKN